MRLVHRRNGDDGAAACVAMLARISYRKAADALGATKSASAGDIRQALDVVGVQASRRAVNVDREALTRLDEDAVVLVTTEGRAHWAAWDGRRRQLLDGAGGTTAEPRACYPVYRRLKPSRQTAERRASDLLSAVCAVAGDRSLLDAADVRVELADAVRSHDDGRLFDWLIEALQFQGVSDQAARTYWARGGGITGGQVEAGLAMATCPKLKAFSAFDRCGYQKGANTCSLPANLTSCPLPKHDLRNGRLNQTAYSLRLFMRDQCDGDFVSWLDRQLAAAPERPLRTRAARLAQAVVQPMKAIFGVSDKILRMALSDLLLSAAIDRPLWAEAGGGMIAVDTLVHNWMHRTGLLTSFDANHAYGPACYGPRGCAILLRRLAGKVDARRFNPAYPRSFPRFVQHAIWRFCSQDHDGRCNGVRIDDRKRCKDEDCPLSHACARVALKPST